MSNIAAKAISTLFAIALGFLATSTMANTDNAAIAERIKPVGSVCVEGDDCGGASAAPAAAGGARSAADLYTTKCAACHTSGVLGAPKFGTSEWTDRAAGKGLDTLVNNAINGINAMPPRGTCADCSDDEIKSLVEYMVDSAK
ncbi:c-type cytochrome [Amphritea sp. HPY]|uniref:c-type cytochrome n=1 Tax=Amphritea sp. HPY TaxID=3421652 RepID=UPI003D7DBDB1